MKIVNVVGARPNYMKIAPLIEEMEKHAEIETLLVHTGQHYDENMSKLFFEDLSLPKPDVYLGIGSGTHAFQTAQIMIEFEKVLVRERPDLVIVVGDVNSTVACALTATKLGIKIAHVEAGLRSFDRSMPEEINRLLTDAISDFLFITEKSAEDNLLKEGKARDQIFFAGNVMIDTLLKNKEKARQSQILDSLKLRRREYALLTLHRPSNVDDEQIFVDILKALDVIRRKITVVYPVHPRTKKKIEEFKLTSQFPFLEAGRTDDEKRFIMVEPLGYLDFLQLMSQARCVLTDSGGIQEETTVLGIPCITLRHNTERPVTIDQGTNTLVGADRQRIIDAVCKALEYDNAAAKVPVKWDGSAASRIVQILLSEMKK